VQRLRNLSEAECYARCYGGLGTGEAVRVVRVEPKRRLSPVGGELVRLAFEAKIDARPPEAA
jgi:hypothetical protein